MPITRCWEQSRCSLEEFYQEVEAGEALHPGLLDHFPGVGQGMLRLLRRLGELFVETQLWGLTSHAWLNLQAADSSAADSLVTIVAGLGGDYYVEYLLPTDARPWPGATVRGRAESLPEAEHYLLIAMRESRGWEGNAELAALLVRYGLAG